MTRPMVSLLAGDWRHGWVRVTCRPLRGGCGWWMDADTWVDACHLGRHHRCPNSEPVTEVLERFPARWPEPDWATLLESRRKPAPRLPRMRAVRLLTDTIRGVS